MIIKIMSCNKFRCDKNRVISIAALETDAENMYKSCNNLRTSFLMLSLYESNYNLTDLTSYISATCQA